MNVFNHSVVGNVFILSTSGSSRIPEGIAYIANALKGLDGKYYLLVTDFGTDLNPDLDEARQLASYILAEEKLHNVMSVSVVNVDQYQIGKELKTALAMPEIEIEFFLNEREAIRWLQWRK